MEKNLKNLQTFEQYTDKNLNIYGVINRLTESSKLTKTLRKLGWFGETWTPQEYKTQVRKLSDETLLLWFNSKDTPIPNTPFDFQRKLVKLEVERRGLSEAQENLNISDVRSSETIDARKIVINNLKMYNLTQVEEMNYHAHLANDIINDLVNAGFMK